MRFVAKNTSIPVPKVQQCWCADRVTYITMNVVDGEELHVVWHDMSQKTKRRVVAHLKDLLNQLHALKPPIEGAVTSGTGGALRVSASIDWPGEFQPFQSHYDHHHQFVRGTLPIEQSEATADREKIVASHRQHYATKFTHEDFAPKNIMVKSDSTITAIIHWDSAGPWIPEYGEYIKANYSSYAPDDWVERIGEMTGRYDE